MKTFWYFFISSLIFTILITCVCCFLWIGIAITVGNSNDGESVNGHTFNQKPIDETVNENKIAVISVNGVIFDGNLGPFGGVTAQSDVIIAQLDLAMNDDEVKGILLNIDSPGGEVIASDDIFRKLKEVSEKKPVVVYSEGLLASGAYYISMGTDYIVVNEFNLTGSIGVYAEFYNYDGLYEKLGINVKRVTNTNGTYKLGEQLYDDDPTDPVETNLVRSLDVVYDRFVSIIAESRGIDEATLRSSIAKGQVYDSYTAVDLGLVDQIGTEDDAYNKLLEMTELDSAQRITYQEQLGFFDFFSGPSVLFNTVFRSEGGVQVFYM